MGGRRKVVLGGGEVVVVVVLKSVWRMHNLTFSPLGLDAEVKG